MAAGNGWQVVWFKRDLRVGDHRPLAAAARRGPVLPLYVVEPDFWRQPDAAARHWLFIRESLMDLSKSLGQLGQSLVVRHGAVRDILETLHRDHGIAGLWSHEETGNDWTFRRDRMIGAWARANGIVWTEYRQDGVQRRLRTRDGWARAWDKLMAEPITPPPQALTPLPGIAGESLPTARDLGLEPDGCVAPQAGGRAAALATLDGFLRTRGETYRSAMSSPLAGARACSRVSPHLAFGTLSLRETTQAGWARLRELKGMAATGGWRGALVSFTGRLHWHCHFMQKLESEPALEFTELHPAARGLRPPLTDRSMLDAWASGQTGFPFLDACMRSLRATGWLNFRMRAMTMSFASYNLWLPWRESGLHLARLFTDYEPGIHWPQTQMQSGATGINTIRIYNVIKQGHDQDPKGVFIRRWLPELRDVPDACLHEPWQWEGVRLKIGDRYPERIVDLAASTASAKGIIYGIRRKPDFGRAADAIRDKHGSRKSGMPLTGQRPRIKKNRHDPLQTELDL